MKRLRVRREKIGIVTTISKIQSSKKKLEWPTGMGVAGSSTALSPKGQMPGFYSFLWGSATPHLSHPSLNLMQVSKTKSPNQI